LSDSVELWTLIFSILSDWIRFTC